MTYAQSLLAVCLVATTLLMVLPPASLAQVSPTIDPDIPAYVPQTSVSGTLTISSPEAMRLLVESWADGLIRRHPDLKVSVIREGSATDLAALFERRMEITVRSRRMAPAELTDCILEFGYEPIEVPVARHTASVLVQHDPLNPEALGSAFVAAHGWASVGSDERMNQYGVELRPTDRTISMARPLLTAAMIDGRYGNPLVPTKMGRVHLSQQTHDLSITRPSRSNPTPQSAELVRYALSRQGQQLVLDLGQVPLSFGK
ncbi:MAG: hypothetical protein AAB308_06205 [Nitrospirota bacterium]